MNSEQLEAHAVDAIKPYTQDIYVGPDIETECMEQILNPTTDELMYLRPVTNSIRRVIVAKLKHVDDLKSISKELIPMCFAIGHCVSNPRLECVVKWYNLSE